MCKWGNTTLVDVDGEPKDIDDCIADLVQLLNDNGYPTVASCCGHGKQTGRISLEHHRELLLVTYEQATKIDKLFPPIND